MLTSTEYAFITTDGEFPAHIGIHDGESWIQGLIPNEVTKMVYITHLEIRKGDQIERYPIYTNPFAVVCGVDITFRVNQKECQVRE